MIGADVLVPIIDDMPSTTTKQPRSMSTRSLSNFKKFITKEIKFHLSFFWNGGPVPILNLWPLGNWMKFRYVIFKQILVVDGWGIASGNGLVSSGYYLIQCWLLVANVDSLSPYGVVRPQWVKKTSSCYRARLTPTDPCHSLGTMIVTWIGSQARKICHVSLQNAIYFQPPCGQLRNSAVFFLIRCWFQLIVVTISPFYMMFMACNDISEMEIYNAERKITKPLVSKMHYGLVTKARTR